ncbi:MAG: DUF2339 domain-containing protein [Pseudomonadota bacterium]
MSLLITIGVLFVLLGLVFGWLAFFRVQTLERQLEALKLDVKKIRSAQLNDKSPDTSENLAVNASSAQQRPAAPEENAASNDVAVTNTIPAKSRPDVVYIKPRTRTPRTTSSGQTDQLAAGMKMLKDNWMSWLGGICVGFAGIFLARYSIEQGLLGPAARIVIGLISGVGMHVGALWLHRSRGAHSALAALAAGGSITLFAALLSALHMYQLISPLVTFVLLAIVALATMWLALLHGPILAALGILGAYTLPIMIGGNNDSANSVLLYVLLVSAAGLYLLRYIERLWLWAGVLTGGVVWWLLTLATDSVDPTRGWYMYLLTWIMFAIPYRDWLLQVRSREEHSSGPISRYWSCTEMREKFGSFALAILITASVISLLLARFDSQIFMQWAPFTIVVLRLAGMRLHLTLHAWALLLLQICAWLAQYFLGVGTLPTGAEWQADFYWYCVGSCVLYSGFALINSRLGDWKPWLPMALLAPVGFLVLAWIVTGEEDMSLQWSLLAVVLGAAYAVLAWRAVREKHSALATAWFFIAAHFAYALAVAMYLREATLTLALAAQLISIAWVIRKFDLAVMGWLLKLVVAVVLCRLTLNPWLSQYPADVHWSLWTYGGATLCCWFASRQLFNFAKLQDWTQGAFIHLFALTVLAELRYWLYDGNVFALEYTAIEAGLDVAVFGTLGLIYHWRERFTSHLAWLYRIYAALLLGFALYSYGTILFATLSSSFWITSKVSATFFFNSIWLLFAVPVVVAIASYRLYLPGTRKLALGVALLGGFVFVNLEIRHFWLQSISLQIPAFDAELYTYSAVWLLVAIVAILSGARRTNKQWYQAGLGLLLLVVLKLFLVDMSDLQGLLRVASFLGMGLGLLGIAYLHKRLQFGDQDVRSATQ